MTNSNPSPAPLPIPLLKYGIIWTLTKGNAIYPCEANIDGIEYVNMDRDDNEIPIIPDCGGELGANDDRNPGGDEEEEDDLSWFHTEYKWNTVELSYDFKDEKKRALKNFNIDATVYAVTETSGLPDMGDDEVTYTYVGHVPFRVVDCKIISDDPNSGGTWVFPDDYDVEVDPEHPKQYGGVIMTAQTFPRDFEAGEKYRCGIKDGPNNDGIVPWLDSNNRRQRIFSGYKYLDVFDDVDFQYIPRNTYENYVMDAEKNDTFQTNPIDRNMMDSNDLHAPVLPMNAITAFIPDPRESVKVTYRVSLDVQILDNNGTWIKSAKVENPNITITQVVEQDTSDYIEQLNQLQSYCMFSNPQEFSADELSPNYMYDYPYTMIDGYEGISGIPTERGDDKDNAPLERGDVYIDKLPGGNRYCWSIGDIPETLTIVDGGSGYEDSDRAMAIYSFPTDHSFDKNLYPTGRPPRNFSVTNLDAIPRDLWIEIKTKNGKIVSAEVPAGTQARGWKDGDTIRILGGKNDSELRVNIDEGPGWSTRFINKY